jgi:hypothetical protein
MVEPTACEKRWAGILASFQINLDDLREKQPESIENIKTLHAGLITIGQLIHSSPRVNGNGEEWKSIITQSEEERIVLCKHLEGQTLFSGLLRLYAATHRDLRPSLKQEEEKPAGGKDGDPGQRNQEFREQKRRKRTQTGEKTQSTKTDNATPTPRDPRTQPQGEVPTKNYFAPLRTTDMDVERPVREGSTQRPDGESHQESTSKSGRPPPIVLTSTINLIQLQKTFKGFVSGSFEFRNTRSGTRIVTKKMADFSAIKTFLETNKLPFFTFFPKSEKPVKAVIRHLPLNTPAEDISDGLVSMDFDVISVKQMTTTRRNPPPEGTTTAILPLFLITLTRTAKSQEIFRLKNLCYISNKVEAYKAKNGLTQCHNCQQFGQVWAHCRQPPRCLWCGGGNLHKEIPEKGDTASTPACCNCKLAEGEKAHRANYRVAAMPKRRCRKGRAREHPHHTRCLLRGGAPWQERGPAATRSSPSDGSSRRSTTEDHCAPTPA